MKIIGLNLFLPALMIFSLAGSNFASFEIVATSARQAGMAESFCAIADDSSTLFQNPAGLTHIKRIELNTTYSSLYYGLTDDLPLADYALAFAFPWDRNNGFGIAWRGRQLSGLYREDAFLAGYSRKFWNTLSAGVNLKILRKEYIANEWTSINHVFNQGSKALNWSLDLGMIYISDKHSMGFSILDVTQPDIGIWEKSLIPLTLKLGYAYRFTADIRAELDANYYDKYYKVNLGMENSFAYPFNNLLCRAGFGIGNDNYSLLAFGLGYKFNEDPTLEIDYAFNYPLSGIQTTIGTHLISANMKIGHNRHLTKQEREIEKQLGADFQKARNLYKHKKYISAYELFDNVLKRKPDKIRITKGCQNYLKLITQKMKQMQSPPMSCYAKGFIHYAKSEYQDAFKQWQKLSVLDETFSEIGTYLEKIKKILKKEKNIKTEALLEVGRKMFEQRSYSEAILYLQAARRLGADGQAKRYIEIAKKQIKIIQKKTAKKTKVKKTSELKDYKKEILPQVNQLVREGILEYRLKHYDKARDKFSEILKMDPDNYKVRLYLERVEYRLRVGRENVDEKTDKLYKEAMDKYLKGELKEAIELWEEILTINPSNEKALNNLIRARKELETKAGRLNDHKN